MDRNIFFNVRLEIGIVTQSKMKHLGDEGKPGSLLFWVKPATEEP